MLVFNWSPSPRLAQHLRPIGCNRMSCGLFRLSHPNVAAACEATPRERGLFAILLVTLLVAPVLWAQSQVPPTTTSASKSAQSSQELAPTPGATGAADRAIPLPQIADRAEELDRWLREVTIRLTP